MAVTSNPVINAQLLAALGLAQPDQYTILITGQIGSGGSAVSGTAYEDVERKTNDEITDLFGDDSELTGRILRCRSNIQGRVPIWVIGIAESGTGIAATNTVTVTGSATEDGTITMKLIDSELYTISVDVLTGDTNNDIATAIKAEIDALVGFPASAGTVTTGAFTLTANDVGTIPNEFTSKVVETVAGVTITDGQFSGGANDPALITIFDNVQTQRFHAISWPWKDDYSVLDTFLEGRNVINNAFLHGIAFIGLDDTEANIKSKLNGTTPENSQNLVFMGNRAISGDNVIVTPPSWRAAEFISIEALRLTEGIPIGRFVTTSASRDQIGGPALASLPYHNTPLRLTDIAPANDLFSGTAQSNLKNDGFSIVGVNSSKTSMITGQLVTTYKFNTIGDSDESFKFLNYCRTGYLALEIFYNTLKSDYSQFRLTQGDLIPGRAITNVDDIKAKYLSIYQRLSRREFVLTQAGSDAEKFFFDNLSVDVNIAEGSVTTTGLLPIVTQLREIIISFRLNFTVGG